MRIGENREMYRYCTRGRGWAEVRDGLGLGSTVETKKTKYILCLLTSALKSNSKPRLHSLFKVKCIEKLKVKKIQANFKNLC